MLRFFDAALDERHNTINVVVGGDASDKKTKLRALVYAAGGRARFVSGDHFHNELLARADIYLDSPQRPIVVIAGSSRDLPPIEEDDAELSTRLCRQLTMKESNLVMWAKSILVERVRV